uniref:Uncharacterized protein n=1 Tax=Setaria digitata TaxID=48799 RepID=A0A915Q1F2_9BILA
MLVTSLTGSLKLPTSTHEDPDSESKSRDDTSGSDLELLNMTSAEVIYQSATSTSNRSICVVFKCRPGRTSEKCDVTRSEVPGESTDATCSTWKRSVKDVDSRYQ